MKAMAIDRPRRAGLAASLFCAAVLTASCGGIVPGASAPAPDLFTLSSKSAYKGDLPLVEKQIVINEPLATRGLDTDRIALRPSPIRVDYFAASRWTDRAPKMIQTLLVESFENSGKAPTVGRLAIGLRFDFSLIGELRAFQAEYFHDSDAPKIRVRLNMKLVRLPESRIIDSASFESEADAQGTGIDAIVEAFDRALGGVMRKTVEWSLAQIAAVDRLAPKTRPNLSRASRGKRRGS